MLAIRTPSAPRGCRPLHHHALHFRSVAGVCLRGGLPSGILAEHSPAGRRWCVGVNAGNYLSAGRETTVFCLSRGCSDGELRVYQCEAKQYRWYHRCHDGHIHSSG